MKSQIPIWQLAINSLRRGIPVALLYVLESRGSSPGRQGFFMVVTRSGDMKGSIGGGIMEHKLAELAKERLKNEEQQVSTIIRRQVHDAAAVRDRSGMICAGEQTVMIRTLEQRDRSHLELLVRSLEEGKAGCLSLSADGISFSFPAPEKDVEFNTGPEESWTYRERTGYRQQLFLVGGGHCALALSRLMSGMDFYIRLYEHRPALNTVEENHFVHEKIFLEDYSELEGLIPSGNRNYVMIMTLGYRTDAQALRALLNKELAYLGMLGSQAKTDELLQQFRTGDWDEQKLKKIHAPAGLFIKSETPEEIAVSIAAEIIQVKNTRR